VTHDLLSFAYDPVYQRYYLAGTVSDDVNSYVPPIFIGGDSVPGSNSWLAAFNIQGQPIWLKAQPDSTEISNAGVITTDNNGDIIMAGVAFPGVVMITGETVPLSPKVPSAAPF